MKCTMRMKLIRTRLYGKIVMLSPMNSETRSSKRRKKMLPCGAWTDRNCFSQSEDNRAYAKEIIKLAMEIIKITGII
jgi:hypothetical protein